MAVSPMVDPPSLFLIAPLGVLGDVPPSPLPLSQGNLLRV